MRLGIERRIFGEPIFAIRHRVVDPIAIGARFCRPYAACADFLLRLYCWSPRAKSASARVFGFTFKFFLAKEYKWLLL